VGAGEVDKAVRVALVDDHDVVLDGERTWIEADPGQRAVVVGAGETVEEALWNEGATADVVVLDLELADKEISGSQVTSRVTALCDLGYRVMVFSVHVEPLLVHQVLAAGAAAFLDKRTERAQFVDTIVAIGHDLPFVTPSMAGGMLELIQLSPREREALQHFFQGMTRASIARRMPKADGEPISPDTVKQYIDRARAKFAASGRPCRSNFALLARCMELGLIRPEEIGDYRPGEYS
jgi:two-component system nitrate/nitrite response regulator NarL